MHTAVDYQAALIEQNRLFTETVFSTEPETPIPTCPGWTMRQLIRHVGRAHRWAAHIISTRADVTLDPRTVPDGRPPDDADGARAWLLGCPQVLLDAVADVGGTDATVATFDGPRPARWWIRRLLHESTVHRADAVLAVDEHYELAPEVASDGIDEWLGRLTERPWPGGPPIGDGKAVTVIATDVDVSWSIVGRGKSLQLRRNSTDSLEGVQLAGGATDLFLALLRRRDVEDAECRVEGDLNSWETFLTLTPYAAPGTE
jgi:uncharacterized protein (TIGR03083 family)